MVISYLDLSPRILYCYWDLYLILSVSSNLTAFESNAPARMGRRWLWGRKGEVFRRWGMILQNREEEKNYLEPPWSLSNLLTPHHNLSLSFFFLLSPLDNSIYSHRVSQMCIPSAQTPFFATLQAEGLIGGRVGSLTPRNICGRGGTGGPTGDEMEAFIISEGLGWLHTLVLFGCMCTEDPSKGKSIKPKHESE